MHKEHEWVTCRCTGIIFKILEFFVCIPCCIRNQNCLDFQEWFRKRSVYLLRIYWGVVMKIQFPVSANAKIGKIRSVVLKGYFRKSARSSKEYVGFSHISSITQS